MGVNKVIVITLIIFFSLLTNGCGRRVFSCQKWLKDDIEPKTINGVVIWKSENKDCLGAIVVQQFNESVDTLKFCTCLQYRKTWDSISEGDTVIKKKNTIQLEITNGEKRMSFDYPCCDQ
ncbi:MAG: hypothetical protein IPO83_16625 [Chitinophagaceae bacterium]|nr:hypothetical protein [Chitinophagaceae bacterium]